MQSPTAALTDVCVAFCADVRFCSHPDRCVGAELGWTTEVHSRERKDH